MDKNLIIKSLSVSIENKKILDNINFEAKTGDVVAIIGPNGAGKSTLLKSMMNHFDTKICEGEIIYNNEKINNLSTDKIAKLGIYYCSQNPIELDGVKLIDLYKMINNKSENKSIELFDLYSKVTPQFKKLNMDLELLNRNNNVGFSGGQKKKNELIQMQLFNPDVILIDEIDSGSDVDTIKEISTVLNNYKKDKIIFIISHQHELLELIKPNKVLLIANNKLQKIGDYSFLQETLKKGFSDFINNKEKEFLDIDFLKYERN